MRWDAEEAGFGDAGRGPGLSERALVRGDVDPPGVGLGAPSRPSSTRFTQYASVLSKICEEVVFESRGPGWRINCSVEVTELSTNKQHTISSRS